MTFVLFVLPFAMGTLTEILHLPGAVRYLMDLILAVFCIIMIKNRFFVINPKVKPLTILVFVFMMYTLVVYAFNFQSPFYYLWGFRNNFRCFIAFFVYVTYVCGREARSWLKLLDVLFWVQLVLIVIQFFAFDVRGDLLGGLFGITEHTNGYTTMLLCIVVSKSLLSTFSQTEKVWLCVLKCLASLFISSMTEIKFFSVMFVVILVASACITKLSKRKVFIVLAGIAGVLVFSSVLVYWYDEFENYLSFESLWELATKDNYSSQNDLNRLSAIFVLIENYVENPLQQLFGMGLGNCDMSSVPIFNSVFYQTHSYLHYTWFYYVMLFMETGFVGLGLYLSFFVICFIRARKIMKRGNGDPMFCRLAMLTSLVCTCLVFYNASLRIEAGYTAFFILSLPFLEDTEQYGGIRQNIDQNKTDLI